MTGNAPDVPETPDMPPSPRRAADRPDAGRPVAIPANDPQASGSDRPRSVKGTIAWVLAAGAWLYAIVVLAGPDNLTDQGGLAVNLWYVTFMSRVFSFHAGLAAIPVALILAALRCRRQAIALAPVIAVCLLPAWRVLRPAPAEVPGDSRSPLRVMVANLYFLSDDHEPLATAIAEADADVLVLLELTSRWEQAIERACGDRYPYRVGRTRENAFGAAIYSRFPTTSPVTADGASGLGELAAPRAAVRYEGREVVVSAVHLFPPYRSRLVFMRRQFAALLDEVRGESRPQVVAGDFNFTLRTAMHAAMRSAGLVEAYEAVGYGSSGTWPACGLFGVLPRLHLDHVYAGSGLVPLSCRTVRVGGSDHLPVIVELGWGSDGR